MSGATSAGTRVWTSRCRRVFDLPLRGGAEPAHYDEDGRLLEFGARRERAPVLVEDWPGVSARLRAVRVVQGEAEASAVPAGPTGALRTLPQHPHRGPCREVGLSAEERMPHGQAAGEIAVQVGQLVKIAPQRLAPLAVEQGVVGLVTERQAARHPEVEAPREQRLDEPGILGDAERAVKIETDPARAEAEPMSLESQERRQEERIGALLGRVVLADPVAGVSQRVRPRGDLHGAARITEVEDGEAHDVERMVLRRHAMSTTCHQDRWATKSCRPFTFGRIS